MGSPSIGYADNVMRITNFRQGPVAHVEAGSSVEDLVPGHTVGGEDVGAWIQRQQGSSANLTPAQRAAPAGVGVRVTEQTEQPAALASPARADPWTFTFAAASAYPRREGHLTVSRKHVETIEHDCRTHRIKLGVALADARQRRAAYAPELLDALTALDMRWT
ncbi:hypothetical protein ACFZBU_41295 [Embleya sp. NPDC008237]|uniref:hypothetical protein n=1 Tax=Embleya sp. NPDC008237 TaxID=3363978 RepID=UPI0036F14928